MIVIMIGILKLRVALRLATDSKEEILVLKEYYILSFYHEEQK